MRGRINTASLVIVSLSLLTPPQTTLALSAPRPFAPAAAPSATHHPVLQHRSSTARRLALLQRHPTGSLPGRQQAPAGFRLLAHTGGSAGRSLVSSHARVLHVTGTRSGRPHQVLPRPHRAHTLHLTRAGGTTIVVNTSNPSYVAYHDDSVADLLANPGHCGPSPGSEPCISLADAILAINNTGPGYGIAFDVTTYPDLWPNGPLIKLQAVGGLVLDQVDVKQPDTTIDGSAGTGHAQVAIEFDPFYQPWEFPLHPVLVEADHVTIKNLITQGIALNGANAHDDVIAGNYLGIDGASKPLSMTVDGIGVLVTDGAHDNVIGGARSVACP